MAEEETGQHGADEAQEQAPRAAQPADGADRPRRTRRPRPLVAVLAVLIAVCLVGAAGGGAYLVHTYFQVQEQDTEGDSVPATPDSSGQSGELVDNPIDFDELQEQNSDIYSWIYVPGTKVNYPILQSSRKKMDYYLTHDADKEKSALGAIYTQAYNSKTWADPGTIVYGHNGADETMFGSLHRFEDKSFFKKHKKFYIYTPGHIYTYKVVSAYTTDNRHLLYVYHMFNKTGFRQFLKDIQNPDSIEKNTRKVRLTMESYIVVLSTCNTGALEKYGRYLVTGVLVDDQPTN